MTQRLVVGVQPVREALRAHGGAIHKVVMLARTPRLNGLEQLARSLSVNVEYAASAELERLCKGVHHQGAIAYAPELRLENYETLLDGATLILALDGIQDPQNFGAAIRSAVGVASAPIVWSENASAPLTAATFRASAGAIEHATLCRVPSLVQALYEASAKGFEVIGLDAHAERPLRQFDLAARSVLVVGGEGRGLSRSVRKACTAFGRLALPNTIDSLNASVSAALALYEAQSQRQAESASTQ